MPPRPPSPTAWPHIVGYQYERMHTGVLHALLTDERFASTVGREFLGSGDTTGVSVAEVRREPRLSGSKGRADLRFEARTSSGCETVWVETKVDTVPTVDQLRRTVPDDTDGHRGVYFTVGYSDVLLPEAALEHRRANEVPSWRLSRWRTVGLERWSALLAHLDLPVDLATYRDVVDVEVRMRETARRLATQASWSAPEVEGVRLGAWGVRVSWLGLVRHALAQHEDAWWSGWSSVNGHAAQVGCEIAAWKATPKITGDDGDLDWHANVYFEVITDTKRRWLAVKAGGSDARRRAAVALPEVADAAMSGPGSWKRSRSVSSNATSQTLATLDLSDCTPHQAVELVRAAQQGIDHAASAAAQAVPGAGSSD